MDRQQHAVPDPTGLVSAEVFDTGDEPELNRHEALAAGIRAHLVEYVPEPFAGEPEAYLPGRVQNPVPLLRDVDRLKPALAQLAEAGDRENAGLVAFGLQPVLALAARVEAATAFRDDALGADLSHGFEELRGDASEMIHIDDPFAPGGADHVAQQRLPVLDRAAAEIVA